MAVGSGRGHGPRVEFSRANTLDARGVAAASDIIAVRIQDEVDGEATAEVWVGPVDHTLTCIYDGTLVTVSGVVILGDAGDEMHAPAEIGEGHHRLRVLVDDEDSPERVLFEFTSVAR